MTERGDWILALAHAWLASDGAVVKKAGPTTASSAADNVSLLRENIDRHVSELARFEQERTQTNAPNLNAYIEATQPVIEEHLKLARRLLSAMSSVGADQTPVERGRYLARVGDCESCHTRDGGEPYAGGRALKTPYGGVIILFDSMVQDGDTGGPLIHVSDGHIVGIVSGRFEPAEVVRGSADWERRPARDTNISFAVDIDYGVALMRAEGLFEHD